MEDKTDGQAGTGNSLLDSLSIETRRQILPLLKLVDMKSGQVVSEPNVRIHTVYFPVKCVISTVSRMLNGHSVEVGLTGHEGMSALSLAFGSATGPHATMVQIADSALSMSADVFLQQLTLFPDLRNRVTAFAEYAFNAATQFAACNGQHLIAARYARWVLMASDRAGSDTFSITQDFLSQMLGVRRPSVTTVADAMRKAGLISYIRGQVAILDRPGLEAASCECYAAVNAALKKSMGFSV